MERLRRGWLAADGGVEAMAHGKLEDKFETTAWLSQTTQQIQVLDYELHATLRVVGAGGTLNREQRARSLLLLLRGLGFSDA
jgi:hypothetical protein